MIATNAIVTDAPFRLCLGSWRLTLRLVLLLMAMGRLRDGRPRPAGR